MASAAAKNGEHASGAAFFLGLEVQNVRCFGPRQKLDLSDGKGRPKPWTIILGDSGVGKGQEACEGTGS
jgi:hypothetical protein